jgi:hypothetical protein
MKPFFVWKLERQDSYPGSYYERQRSRALLNIETHILVSAIERTLTSLDQFRMELKSYP